MRGNKNGFVLYKSYKKQIAFLDMEQRGVLLTAIMAHACGEELPDMDGMTEMLFSVIRDQMDEDEEKYWKTVEARREAGKLGGRPAKAEGFSEKQEETKKANGFSEKQKKQMVFSEKQNNPDKDMDKELDKDIVKKESIEKKRFAPPTRQDVAEYVREKGYSNIDVDRFVDYYTSNGWMVGKNKMKDWKSAVRNWNRSDSQRQESATKGSKNRFHNFDERAYTQESYEALEKQLLGAEGGVP